MAELNATQWDWGPLRIFFFLTQGWAKRHAMWDWGPSCYLLFLTQGWAKRHAMWDWGPLHIFFFQPKAELNVMQCETENLCISSFFNPRLSQMSRNVRLTRTEPCTTNDNDITEHHQVPSTSVNVFICRLCGRYCAENLCIWQNINQNQPTREIISPQNK